MFSSPWLSARPHANRHLVRRDTPYGEVIVDTRDPSPRLEPLELGEAIEGLRQSTMFCQCSEFHLRRVASRMQRREFSKGEMLMQQGEPQNRMFVVTAGTVQRTRYEAGRVHDTETLGATRSMNTVGALHLLRCEPTYATAQCKSDVVAYCLSSEDLNELLESPPLAKEVVFALTREVKRQSQLLRTPLLEQKPLAFPIVATSVAAGVESFYRSALNSWLNYCLTGQASPLFPAMHLQLPTRVLYINGFKGARQYIGDNVVPEDYDSPDVVRLVMVRCGCDAIGDRRVQQLMWLPRRRAARHRRAYPASS